MPWIENTTYRPLEEGYYKCLIIIDEIGTLSESENQKFNGQDWDPFESSCQFIAYWWAHLETMKKINEQHEKDFFKYCEEVQNEYLNNNL